MHVDGTCHCGHVTYAAEIDPDTFFSTPEQFAALMRADTAKFAKVIKAANIKLD